MNVRNEVQSVIFDQKDGKLVMLVQKKDRRAATPHWRLLKGGVNEGETEVEALRREIFEETGLKNIKIMGQVHKYEFIFNEVRHTVSSFLVKADSREPVRLQESELAGYAWMQLENANRLLYWRNEKEAVRKLSQFP
ncbi:MAG: NUDIX hydrolase [Candidatus Bathyarchaeia archaeon]